MVEAVHRGNDFLETLATILGVQQNNPRATPTIVKSQVASLKPRLANYIEEAYQFLAKNQLAQQPT